MTIKEQIANALAEADAFEQQYRKATSMDQAIHAQNMCSAANGDLRRLQAQEAAEEAAQDEHMCQVHEEHKQARREYYDNITYCD